MLGLMCPRISSLFYFLFCALCDTPAGKWLIMSSFWHRLSISVCGQWGCQARGLPDAASSVGFESAKKKRCLGAMARSNDSMTGGSGSEALLWRKRLLENMEFRMSPQKKRPQRFEWGNWPKFDFFAFFSWCLRLCKGCRACFFVEGTHDRALGKWPDHGRAPNGSYFG
ncbi:hypothetical protein BC940DRAFT_109935 [Gongronella butleri]|nr:hypothetical protein BC940DRAFT_109935 [Gongronella butleri]